jgi:acyl-CoA synthetase (AMP-forming)/AMP-acid ligase II
MTADTLLGALESAARRWPDRVAVAAGGERATYRDVMARAGALAHAYRRMGIRRGDRIACSLSNRTELVIALAAAWECGAVHVGVDHQFTTPELSRALTLTRARAVVLELDADGASAPRDVGALRAAHAGVHFIAVGGGAPLDGCRPFDAVLRDQPADADQADTSPDRPTPDGAAIIFLSSGTTGVPKATLGYHGNLAQRWQRLGGWLRFSPDDVHLAQLPLTHGFGLMMAVSALITGGRLVLRDRFSAEDALATVEADRVTVLNGAPAHFRLILRRLDGTRRDLRSLRLSVGTAAPFSGELIRAICDRLGVEFVYMYGSSEGVGVATADPDDVRRGSVGRPEPGSVAIVGPDRAPLPVGETGEIAFSRRVYPVRYWRGTEAEPTTIGPPPATGENEWFYSGDLGRVDDAGRLYVLGRLKHQIDRGGLKVDPVEVESALLRHPDVADAAVVGVPDPIMGEVVCACVVPSGEAAPSLEELRHALRDELASYKLPEELCILDRIPRTALGKVEAGRLQAEAAAAQRHARV